MRALTPGREMAACRSVIQAIDLCQWCLFGLRAAPIIAVCGANQTA